MESIIKTSGLTKQFGTLLAVSDLNLEVPKGTLIPARTQRRRENNNRPPSQRHLEAHSRKSLFVRGRYLPKQR